MEKSNNYLNSFNNDRVDDSSLEEGEIFNSPKNTSSNQKSNKNKIMNKNENINYSACQSQIISKYYILSNKYLDPKIQAKCKNEEEIFNSFKNNISKINDLFNLQNSLEKKEIEKKNFNIEKQNFIDIKIGKIPENKINQNNNFIDQSNNNDDKNLNSYEDANQSYLKNSSLFTISIESEKDNNNSKTEELISNKIENEKIDMEITKWQEDGFKTAKMDGGENKNKNENVDSESKDHEKYIKNRENINEDKNIYSNLVKEESENNLTKKKNENKIQYSFLTENQIIENKDFLNKKNFVINEPNENNDKYLNNNHIKIKILDDNPIIIDKDENYSSNILNNLEIDVENDISRDNSREEANKELIQENSNNLPIKSLGNNYNENKLFSNKMESDIKRNDKNEEIVEENFFKDNNNLEISPQKLHNTTKVFHFLNNTNADVIDTPFEDKIKDFRENKYSDTDKMSNSIPFPNLSKPNIIKNESDFPEKDENNQLTEKNESLNKVDSKLINKNNPTINTPKAIIKPIHENQEKDKFIFESNKEKQLEPVSNSEQEGIKKIAQFKRENFYSVKVKDSKKDKEKKNKKSIGEKKIGSKNCIYCKIEITDPSLFLKFKSSDDFLTYCKLYFEKLSQQKKEFYSKSIASFDKYYTEKYSNFEQTNNIIFNSVKTICKICYEENIKEENGFINILAALNYNIIINNRKNLNFKLNKEQECIQGNNNIKIEIPNQLIKVDSKKNQTPTLTSNKSKDLNMSLEEIQNINKSANDVKFSVGNMQEIQIGKEFTEEDLLFEKSSMNNKKNLKNNEIDLELSGKKRNSINSDMDSLLEKANLQNSFWNCSNRLELDSSKNANILKNNLLGKKLNRIEGDSSGLKQKNSKNIINFKINQNPFLLKEGMFFNKSLGNPLNESLANNVFKNNDSKTNNLIANQINDNRYKSSNSQFLNKNKDNINNNLKNEGSLSQKNTVNSKLNLNNKNISLENLNITNVFMNFDEKNGSKPILIDSNLSNNQNNSDNSYNLKNKEIILKNPNFEINRDILKNLENLKKNYVDLNNFSIEKKLFLNSFQKKSELLIQNLSNLGDQKGVIQENNDKLNKEELETEKKIFHLNNLKHIGKLMNTIDEQFENNKNTLNDSKLELKNPTNIPYNNSNLDHNKINDYNNDQITQKKEINCFNNKIENSYNINKTNKINPNSLSNINDKSLFDNENQLADDVLKETYTVNQIPQADQIVNLIENHLELQNNLLNKNYNEKLNLSKGSSNKPNLIDRILNIKGSNNFISNEKINSDLQEYNEIRNSSNNQINSIESLIHKDAQYEYIHQKINTNIPNNQENLSIQNIQNPNDNSSKNLEILGLQKMSNHHQNTNLQNTILNNNGLLISNTVPNNNLLNNLNSGFLLNNSLLETKKSNNDSGHLGTLSLSHPNNINNQTNPVLNNLSLSNLLQPPLSYGLPYISPGAPNLSNLCASILPQQIQHLNSLIQLNPNLISTLNSQTNLILGSNILNSNPIDLNLLGINNSNLQLPLPLSYNLPFQINPSIGLPLTLQNQIQLGNSNNLNLNNNNANQKDLSYKNINGEGNNKNLNNLQVIQQHINMLKGNINNNNFNSIQGFNTLGVNIANQQINLLKNINTLQQNLTIDNYKGQDVPNKTHQLHKIDIINQQSK